MPFFLYFRKLFLEGLLNIVYVQFAQVRLTQKKRTPDRGRNEKTKLCENLQVMKRNNSYSGNILEIWSLIDMKNDGKGFEMKLNREKLQKFRCEQGEQKQRNLKKTEDNRRLKNIYLKNNGIRKEIGPISKKKTTKGSPICLFFCEDNQLKIR